MRRITSFLLAALIAGSLAAPSFAADDRRTVTKPYDAPSGLLLPTLGDTSVFWTLPAATTGAAFRARAGETSTTIEIQDQTGAVTLGHVHIDRDSDGRAEVHKNLCGSTAKPLAVTPGATVEVWPFLGTCQGGTPSVASRGVIEVSFQK